MRPIVSGVSDPDWVAALRSRMYFSQPEGVLKMRKRTGVHEGDLSLDTGRAFADLGLTPDTGA